jgi:hypothetical protein
VAVVATVGAGAYGVGQFLSHGAAPASAVPAAAVAYVGVDLDPSAAQKIEAVKILRKFPALRSELGIGVHDDLRKTIVDRLLERSGCTGVNYDKDVKPWIGERFALAAVPARASGVLPLMVLQVTDEKLARRGVRTLEGCGSGTGAGPGGPGGRHGPAGVAFVDHYMLVTDTQADADRMAAEASSATLADDTAFTTWTGRAGAPGIVTMYASKKAPEALLAAQKAHEERRVPGGSADPLAAGGSRQLERALAGFQGAAGEVRFRDGAVEAEVATSGVGRGVLASRPTGPDMRTLPATTGAALSVAFEHGWLAGHLDMIGQALGGSTGDPLDKVRSATGLMVPQDIETLLGDGVNVSVDSGADLSALGRSPDPAKVPAGIRIKGDPAAITAVINRLKAAAGPAAGLLRVRSRGDLVAVSTDPDYLDALLAKGHLGATPALGRVVPSAGRATGVLFVDFDAGHGWATRLADLVSHGNPRVRANLAPLDALGISSWQDKDRVRHTLLRLTTD